MKNIYMCLVVALLQFSLLEAGNYADNRDNRNHGGRGNNNNNNGKGGSWGVSVNKDKGKGPQLSAGGGGKVWGSKDGNWGVGISGNHEMGRGRKPDSRVDVSVNGRFRRDVVEESMGDQQFRRMEGSLQPQPRDRSILKPHILINTPPSPTIPEHEIRFRREVNDRLWQPTSSDDHPKPHILINRPPIPDQDIRFRREALENKKRVMPDIGQIRTLPAKPDILIYKPTPTFPINPKPEIRFRRDIVDDVTDGVAEDNQDDVNRERRQISPDPKLIRFKPAIPDPLIYRPSPTFPINPKRDQFRFTRDVENADLTEDVNEDLNRNKRSFAPGGGSFPSPGSSSQQGSRGSWGVSVNKDKGRGPQVRTEGQGNIYTSPKGNVRVDGHGHHEFGKGRKPDYGGGVKVGGRWRRDAAENEEVEEDEQSRIKRFAPGDNKFPGSNGGQQDRGSWGVSVNKDKGRGPQVHTEAQGNIYKSPNGNVRVDGHGHHEFGKGRKPDYGGGIKVHGRWRRDLSEVEEPEEDEQSRIKRFAPGDNKFPGSNGGQQDRGSWGVSVNKDKGRGPQVHTEAQGNIYKSPSGNVQVDGHGHHEFGKGRKPDYGGGIKVHGRWRRDLSEVEEPEEDEQSRTKRFAPGDNKFPGSNGGQQDRGSWGVSVNKDKGRGPQVRTEAQGNIYKSPNGNVRVDGQGHHEFGKGRKPDYGVGVKVEGRWRRDLSETVDDEEIADDNDNERVRREANPQRDRGSVSVDVGRGPNGGGQVKTDATYNIYTSPNGNWQVNGNGYHQAGHGQKPSYGGGVTLTGRFRRDVDDILEEVDDGYERVRREANPQKDRGSVSVTVDRGQRGPQVRTDAQYNMYRSRNGNWEVNGNAYHQAGRHQKPSYGAGVSLTGRFRRDVAEEEYVEEDGVREKREANPQNDRGSVNVGVGRGPNGGAQVRTDANYNIYKSPNGNFKLDGNAYHQAGHGQKPTYGVRTDAQYNMYRSRNGHWEVNGNAYHQADRFQKPTYGGGLSVIGRFRRDAEIEDDVSEDEVRAKREANPQKDPKGSVSVSVNRDKGRGPQIRTDVERNIYTSRDKSFRIDGGGYHEAGKGRKPDYGGRVTFTKQF